MPRLSRKSNSSDICLFMLSYCKNGFNVILCFQEAKDLVKKLLCENEKRLGSNKEVDDLKGHSFFGKHFDWDNIRERPAPFVIQVNAIDDTRYRETFTVSFCREVNFYFCGFLVQIASSRTRLAIKSNNSNEHYRIIGLCMCKYPLRSRPFLNRSVDFTRSALKTVFILLIALKRSLW